jgi:hypothetical protein
VCAAAFDWEWFMNHPKARFMSAVLTRTGARTFYAVLGVVSIVFGALIAAGVIQDSG